MIFSLPPGSADSAGAAGEKIRPLAVPAAASGFAEVILWGTGLSSAGTGWSYPFRLPEHQGRRCHFSACLVSLFLSPPFILS